MYVQFEFYTSARCVCVCVYDGGCSGEIFIKYIPNDYARRNYRRYTFIVAFACNYYNYYHCRNTVIRRWTMYRELTNYRNIIESTVGAAAATATIYITGCLDFYPSVLPPYGFFLWYQTFLPSDATTCPCITDRKWKKNTIFCLSIAKQNDNNGNKRTKNVIRIIGRHCSGIKMIFINIKY